MENLNVTKTEAGFKFNNIEFAFAEDNQYHILPENTCHVHTTNCIVFFDLTASIEGQTFETIEAWVAELYA